MTLLEVTIRKLETLPSDFEIEATGRFVKAGQEYNRFYALYQAIGAIAASSIMAACIPVVKFAEGSVQILQGDVSLGVSNIASLPFYPLRSLYNILRVFTTATIGLLPYCNSLMYNDWPLLKSIREQYEEAITNLKTSLESTQKQHDEAMKNLNTQLTGMFNELNTRHVSHLTESAKLEKKSKEEILEAQETIKKLTEQLKEQKQTTKHETTIKDLKIKNLNTQLVELENKYKQETLEAQQSIQKLTKQLEEQKQPTNKMSQNAREISKIKNQVKESKITSLKLQNERLNSQLLEVDKELKKLDDETKRADDAERKIKDLEKRIKELEKQPKN